MIPIPVTIYAGPLGDTRLPSIRERKPMAPSPVVKRDPFLQIHGNVTYDGYYQSNSDTPYLEKDIYQHTLTTNLDITVKNQYPLHLAFSTSKGNSVLFRNLTGINLHYTNRDFKQMLMDKAKGWEAGKLKQLKELDTIKSKLDIGWTQLQLLKSWFNSPAQLQRMVEAKEHDYNLRYRDSLPVDIKSLPRYAFGKVLQPLADLKKSRFGGSDSAVAKLRKEYEDKQHQLDSVQLAYDNLLKLYNKKKIAVGNKKAYLLGALQNSKNDGELVSELSSMNLPDSVLPPGYKLLLSMKSIGIGRTMVDYSELTAKNISITGVQAEFNPSWYLAFATGAVDYRFRDYIVNANRPKQYLNIIRAGVGQKEGNNLILSFYTGKKQVYNVNTGTPTTGTVEMPDYKIMGLSLEGRWQINRYNYVIGEVAKSSTPYYQRAASHESVGGSMMQFNSHHNEAFSVSTFSYIPKTATRISTMYKLLGSDFQSFSLYASGSQQIVWSLKAEQPFFHKQLTLIGSVKRNAYNNIFDSTNYSSKTIFKSIQATFRRKNWPVVSLGYFPSSQLTKTENDRFIENLFYTLVGTASYYYTHKGIGMNSMLSATRFYNKQTDSSFVYFNSTNVQFMQTFFVNALTLSTGVSAAVNQEYALYGADGNAQYRINRWLEIGGGVKYNYQTVFENKQMGYSGNAKISIPKIGEFGLMADKGFVPGVNKQLVPNKTGRLTYTKIF
ncbi:MAG: hypothetical protein JO154_26475 [Chitinophaga sp.]|uniref:hypothetical protein n=1 Tax=Chitinophaga sp. TaxID=1869181 RepID=UPI0025C5B64D|nr:hypothetical protein [Chitinophaga sp.]MBV8256168.1 hypothetical protein [Chitinophaga sp.]